jgi:hypothetical protein
MMVAHENLRGNMQDIQRQAMCSCGQLRLEVKGPPKRVSICHCLACQRRTGSVFGQQARFTRAQVGPPSGRFTVYERVGDEGSHLSFHFCPDCGSTVFYTVSDQPEVIAIPVGAFADPEFPAPRFSVYERRKHGWVVLPQGPDVSHFE